MIRSAAARRQSNGVSLSDDDRPILRMIANGRTNSRIARVFCMSDETLKTKVTRIYHKLGARDRAHAVRRAIELGYLQLSDIRLAPLRYAPDPPPPPVNAGVQDILLYKVRRCVMTAGLNKTELAARTNLSYQQVSKMMAGRTLMTLAHAQEILKACGSTLHVYVTNDAEGSLM